MGKTTNEVSVYSDHRWMTDVQFKYKWQAFLFHELLNRSLYSAGVRNY